MDDAEVKNYMLLDSVNPFVERYIFVDVKRHFFEGIFERDGLPVKVFDKDFNEPGSPFVIVQCSIRSECEEAFLRCMADLDRKILLSGFQGYRSYCARLPVTFGEYALVLNFF